MKYGIQMFGVNPVFEKDPELFLEKVSEAGYGYLEPCFGLDGMQEFMKGHAWDFEALKGYAPLLKTYGMELHSAFVFSSNLTEKISVMRMLHETYGIVQFVLPAPVYETEEDFEKGAAYLQKTAEKLKDFGAELLLHNGDADSVPLADGSCHYEKLLKKCGPIVGAQPDTGWMRFGGTDPVPFLERNRAQIRSLHHKDFEFAADGNGLAETGIGTGLVDTPRCFQIGKELGVIQLADQDHSKIDFIEELKRIADYFHAME